ncbi:MAG: hypothetical protein IRZ08_11275 [Frankia sp.]|nr:hypothetical protein [Frankia sp.]
MCLSDWPWWAGGGQRARQKVADTPARFAVRVVLVVSIGCLLLQWWQLRAGTTGLAAQLVGGSSGGGYVGLAAQLGPPLAAAALLARAAGGALRSPGAIIAAVLVGLHAFTLAYTGFRGAGPFYLLAVLLCAADLGRRRSSLTRRLTAAGVCALAVATLFLFAAEQRVHDVTADSYVGSGAQSVDLDNMLEVVTSRMDHAPFLARGIEMRADASAQAAVALSDQVAAVVPRFLYEQKDVVAYGRAVARAFYGVDPHSTTSSTITAYGDAVVNLGVAGALVLIVGHVALIDHLHRRLGASGSVRALAMRVALLQIAVFNIGTPVVLSLVGMLRICLVVAVLGEVAGRVRRLLRPAGQHQADDPFAAPSAARPVASTAG